MTLGLALKVISLEARKRLSYRVDFWIATFGSLAAHIGVAYFLWRAIFDYRQTDSIGGFTFSGMMIYYVLAPLIDKIIRGEEMGFISTDIYEGSLNRYLIQPLSYFNYKFFAQLAYGSIFFFQLSLALLVYWIYFERPPEIPMSAQSIVLGYITCFFSMYLYFVIAACLEMVSFWADNVWSLLVLLRFVMAFLGGTLLPLSLFPEWSRELLHLLPFKYLIAFPVETFLGRVALAQWLEGLAILSFWALAITGLTRLIWRRGAYRYSGVGI